MSYSSSEIELAFHFNSDPKSKRPLTHSNTKLINDLFNLDQELFPNPWELNNWKKTPDSFHLLGRITRKDELLGFILFGIADPNCAHLYKILVVEGQRRHGFAALLLHGASQILFNLDYKTVYLEVEVSNVAACMFYAKHGYQELIVKKDFYGRGRHAMAMNRDLKF